MTTCEAIQCHVPTALGASLASVGGETWVCLVIDGEPFLFDSETAASTGKALSEKASQAQEQAA